MKTARLHATGDLRVHDEPVPATRVGEALVRVTAVGLCGSDLHWFSEAGIGDARLDRPLILGHECAGVVESCDPASGLYVGQRVAIDPAIPCNQCEYCLEGNPHFCESLHFAGHGEDDGGLRQYMNWPVRCLFPLPETLSDADGAMLEPLGVAIHAVNLSHLKPGMTVGVYGCGPVGLLILQVARAAGATRLIVTDRLPHRVEAAYAMGATQAFEALDGEENAAIWEASGNRGVDIAFEAAGENAAVDTAIETARSGGRVILVGIPSDDRTAFKASTARRKGLTLMLSRRMKHTYPRSIRLVESGQVEVGPVVTHRFSIDETAQAFLAANSRTGLKVVVEP